MRFLLFLALAGSACPLRAPAQWTPFSILNPYPVSNTIHAAAAPSENHLVGVTSHGEAVVTTDGGTTWHVVQMSGGIYRDVAFVDDLRGWAVGAGTQPLQRTTDGGLSWTAVTGTPDTTKYGVDFATPEIGWAVGFDGFIIKTIDGGATWESRSVTEQWRETLYDVAAADSQTLFVAGNNDLLLKSTDGGGRWVSISQVFPSPTDYRAVLLLTPTTGLVAGHGSRIAKTSDGGKSWRVVHNPGGTRMLWSLASNGKGVLLAVGTSSEVLRSTDGGTSWRKLLLPGVTTLTFYSAAFGSENVAYIVGSSGALYKSTDAGATWQ